MNGLEPIINGEKIREIIEKNNIGTKPVENTVSESSLPKATEQVHVFEFGEDSKPEEPVAVIEEPAEEQEPDKSSSAEIIEKKNVHGTRFDIPEAADATAKTTGATPSSIFTTYVPRFTEVSENYRMIGDPRPRKKALSDSPETEVRAETRKEPTEEYCDDTLTRDDPTAEVNETVTEAVLVNMSVPVKDEDADTLNVFKFSGEEAAPAEEKAEWTVDDERADINRLIFGESADRTEPEVEEEELSEPTEEKETPDSAEPKSYTIPDPDSGLKVVDYDDAELSDGPVPVGLSSYAPDKTAKRLTEFELPVQRDAVKDRFLDSLIGIKVRLGAIAVFALLLFAFDMSVFFNWIGDTSISVFAFAGASAVIDGLLSASVFLMTLPETVRAFRCIAKGRIVSELITVISFAVVAIYTALIVMIGVFYTYPLFGFLYSVVALITVISTFVRVSADFAAFKLASDNGEKYILEKRLTRDLAEENYALDGLVDEYSSRTARIFRAAFVTDFFKRTGEETEKSLHIGILLSISLAVSVIVSVISYFVVSTPYGWLSSFVLVFLLSLPAFAVLSHKLSYRDAEELAVSEDGAVIGAAALDEFSEVNVICFEDSDIFGIDDVNLKRFMLYGDRDNMGDVMRQLCSLFSVVKGPLYSMFANALDNRVPHNAATGVVIETDGISGEVNDKKILVGNEEYMLRHGIAIPEGAAVPERGSDTTKVMYAAQNGEIYAKLHIRYSFSEEFTRQLPALRQEGIIPLIYTSDPNISNELLKRLTAGADCIRATKRLTPGATDERLFARVSAGVVTVGDKVNAINLLLLTRKHAKFIKRIKATELFSMTLGAVMASVVALLKTSVVPIALLGAWQVFWCIVLRLASKNVFLKGRKSDNDADEDN